MLLEVNQRKMEMLSAIVFAPNLEGLHHPLGSFDLGPRGHAKAAAWPGG